MSLKIVSKNSQKRAVISILGIQNGKVEGNNKEDKKAYINSDINAEYYETSSSDKKAYFNTLPYLASKYPNYTLIPFFTEDAKIFNTHILKKLYPELISKVDFQDKYLIKDEKDFKFFFNLVDMAINEYDEIIIDVSHGFRHLPILMIVDILIQNFKNSKKIQKILFAKEITKHTREEKGLYEIIDLKEYLDIANISFILTAFEKNFTVANHITSEKYPELIKKINNFSNDIMALSLNNLFKKSAKQLIVELDKINDISIKEQSQKIKNNIKELIDIDGKKRYETYYNLAKNLYEKNYILLSLALIYEGLRLYIKTSIKKTNQECEKIVEKIEDHYRNDLYAIGDFFKNLKWKDYSKYDNKLNIAESQYNTIKKNYPSNIEDLIDEVGKKRNNLAHANADKASYDDVKSDIKRLLDAYYNVCIKPKNSNDLKKFFNK